MNTDKKTEVRSTVEALSVEDTLKLALEALENSRSLEPVDVQWVKGKRHAAITAIRAALASKSEALAHAPTEREQPAPATELREQQEPVAWMRRWAFDGETPTKARNENGRMAWPSKFKFLPVTQNQCLSDDVPLHPPASKPWVGLTDVERDEIYNTHEPYADLKAVEAKLREKNA